jgi:hypothetical protein
MYMGNYAIARENFRRALLCNEDVVGDFVHTQIKGLVYQNLGCLAELQGSIEEAGDMYEKALKIKYKGPRSRSNSATVYKGAESNPSAYDLHYSVACIDLKLKRVSAR